MMKFIFLALMAVLLFAASGCTAGSEGYVPPELIRSPAASIDTAIITRGDLIAVDRRTGITRYLSTPLYFERPVANFGQFYVAPGDYVTEGQLLVILDTEYLDERIEIAVENLANMRRDHALANEIRQLDIDIMVMEHAARVNQTAYNLDPTAAAAIEVQTVSIERAQMELRQQMERHAVQVRQAEIRLQDLRTRRQNAELRAPFDGLITNIHTIQEGQHVGVSVPLVYITDRSQVVIEALNLPTMDWPQPGPGGMPPDPWRPNLVRRAINMTVTMESGTYPIEYIPLTLDERNLAPVRFNVLSDTPLTAGQYVSMHFYTTHLEDVLLIPDNALLFAGPIPYTYRVVDGELIYTELRLASRTQIQAAVIEGLEYGDHVFIR